MRTNATTPVLAAYDFSGVANQQLNPKAAASQLILKWEKKLSSLIRPENSQLNRGQESDEILRNELVNDVDVFYTTILNFYTSAVPKEERQTYIKVIQKLIGRLLTKIHQVLETGKLTTDLFELLALLNKKLGECLVFIEELFFDDFDDKETVPPIILDKRKRDLTHLFQEVLFLFSEKDEATASICGPLFLTIEAFLSADNHDVRFKDVTYYQELLEGLLQIVKHLSFRAVQELLYYHDYNHETFLEYECARLMESQSQCMNDKQRIAVLKMEQKTINQFPVKLNQSHSDHLPSLKQQINNWIAEEVKYLESGYAQHGVDGRQEGSGEKIQTSLSVAKLAVIIRLLVIDKIIINRSVAPMLRVVAGVFTTLQRDSISVGSLEAKYHAPDKATVNLVRDMLFKWINILSKL